VGKDILERERARFIVSLSRSAFEVRFARSYSVTTIAINDLIACYTVQPGGNTVDRLYSFKASHELVEHILEDVLCLLRVRHAAPDKSEQLVFLAKECALLYRFLHCEVHRHCAFHTTAWTEHLRRLFY